MLIPKETTFSISIPRLVAWEKYKLYRFHAKSMEVKLYAKPFLENEGAFAILHCLVLCQHKVSFKKVLIITMRGNAGGG